MSKGNSGEHLQERRGDAFVKSENSLVEDEKELRRTERLQGWPRH